MIDHTTERRSPEEEGEYLDYDQLIDRHLDEVGQSTGAADHLILIAFCQRRPDAA